MDTTWPATQTQLEAFFNSLLLAFSRARAEEGVHSRHLNLAGRAVELSATASMSYLARPLDHLATRPTSNTDPDLTIYAWQGPREGLAIDLPWQRGAVADSVGLATDRFRVNYHAPSGLLCMWDRHTHTALYWVRQAESLPFWEIASPFRILFHWWAQSWGGQVAHAAAVGVEGRGVLLVGKSGSGKSTATLACLRQGLEFVGDDYVLLTTDPVPTAHPLYASAKLHPAALAKYFPEWARHVGARVGPEAKCVLYLGDVPGMGRQKALTLEAMVLPEVTNDSLPAIVPAPPGHTWLALVPSTVFQLPDARETTLAFFSTFTRRLPSFRLTTGRDPQRLPEVIRNFLASATPLGKGT
jgi:hypothetical protein